MTEIQGRQASLHSHHYGQHSGHATVPFPEGVNENQFRMDDSKGVNDLRTRDKESGSKSTQGLLL
jgi:hypothetical protein